MANGHGPAGASYPLLVNCVGGERAIFPKPIFPGGENRLFPRDATAERGLRRAFPRDTRPERVTDNLVSNEKGRGGGIENVGGCVILYSRRRKEPDLTEEREGPSTEGPETLKRGEKSFRKG